MHVARRKGGELVVTYGFWNCRGSFVEKDVTKKEKKQPHRSPLTSCRKRELLFLACDFTRYRDTCLLVNLSFFFILSIRGFLGKIRHHRLHCIPTTMSIAAATAALPQHLQTNPCWQKASLSAGRGLCIQYRRTQPSWCHRQLSEDQTGLLCHYKNGSELLELQYLDCHVMWFTPLRQNVSKLTWHL